MENRKLKKIMTDLAAGHISKKEADKLIKEGKVAEKAPVQAIKEEDDGHSKKQNKIHTELNAKGGKKSQTT